MIPPLSDDERKAIEEKIPRRERLLIEALMDGMAGVIREYVAKVTDPLLARIEELEGRTKNFKYVGVFKQGEAYALGNFATHDGSIWHCNRDTIETPGSAGGPWVLACKRGRNDRR